MINMSVWPSKNVNDCSKQLYQKKTTRANLKCRKASRVPLFPLTVPPVSSVEKSNEDLNVIGLGNTLKKESQISYQTPFNRHQRTKVKSRNRP